MKQLPKPVTLLKIIIITCLAFPCKSREITAPVLSPVFSKEAAAEFLKRPLVLCKREVDPKKAEKLSKKDPEQLKSEETYNNYFNQAMKLYFDSLYKGSKTIELKSEQEVNALIQASSPAVAIVLPVSMDRTLTLNGKTKYLETYSFNMMLPDKNNEEFIISFMSDLLSDADFVFLVQQINIHLQKIIAGETLPSYSWSNKNTAGKLKNLKLIVNMQKIKEGLTKEEITENYKYPIEFVDSLSDYEDIVTGQKPGYAYITSVWSPTLWGAGYIVVDAGTGEILSILSAGGVHVAIGWQPPKTGNWAQDKYNKRYAFDVIQFKVKYSLKGGHFKQFNKLAEESN
ncbi:MAG TPA: hypothetical protein VJY62_21335 [Bacteroidia bacterium]|nr:hypothetical protein [Bacteroidia bacterium]